MSQSENNNNSENNKSSDNSNDNLSSSSFSSGSSCTVDSDSELDIYSSKFNPLKALYAEKELKLPKKDVKIYDNIQHFVPTSSGITIHENKQRAAEKKKNRYQLQQERKSLKLTKSGRRQLSLEEELTNMFEKAIGKPLDLLKKYVENNTLIIVMTRNYSGFRGYIVAYLVAFDKHLNLVLSDVYHCWLRSKPEKMKPVHYIGREMYPDENKFYDNSKSRFNNEELESSIELKTENKSRMVDVAIGYHSKIRNFINDRIKRVNDSRRSELMRQRQFNEIDVIKRFRKKEICESRYNLLLLRGCEVISIYPANAN